MPLPRCGFSSCSFCSTCPCRSVILVVVDVVVAVVVDVVVGVVLLLLLPPLLFVLLRFGALFSCVLSFFC